MPSVDTHTRLVVEGMTCQHCVGRVTDALEAMPHVRAAAVDLEAGTADVTVAEAGASTAELVAAVTAAGYAARAAEAGDGRVGPATDAPLDAPEPDARHGATAELTFAIAGMTCANCANTIEKVLHRQAGVAAANVNFAAERGWVEYDAATLDEPAIFRAVAEAGYHASSTRTRRDRGADARRELLWLGWAVLGVLLVVGLHRFGGAAGIANLLNGVGVAWMRPAHAIMAVALVIQATAGFTFYRGAYHALANRAASMDVLVSLGITAATGYSMAVVLAPALFAGETLFFHTAVELIAFIRFGKYLEARVKGRANAMLRDLLEGQTDRATLVEGDRERAVAASELQPGQVVRVRPGEQVPVDGVIRDGEGEVDEALLTGEPLPVVKAPGDAVMGGSINRAGVLLVEVTGVGQETVLARVIQMVEAAQGDKAPIQRYADRVSNYFVPAVVALAACTFAGHLLAAAGLVPALSAAIAVLVVACPCALGLATPTAIVVGSGIGLRRGILVKRASALEGVARLERIMLDKTGTITEGRPDVVGITPLADDASADSILALAAPVEAGSVHPLAQAVVRYARARGGEPQPAADIVERAGHGVRGTVDGVPVWVGNRRLLDHAGVDTNGMDGAGPPTADASETLLYVATRAGVQGVIRLADRIKGDAAAAVDGLHREGITLVMLTGDAEAAAERVAAEVGVDEVRARLLPEDKIAAVRAEQAAGYTVGMVGDGINDAPALAQADIGLAIGAGADAAKEAGDIVLVRGDLGDVVRAVRLGKATLRTVKQNLGWAVLYNVGALPLAAVGLLPPAWAGMAMALSSVSVVANSLRLRRVDARL